MAAPSPPARCADGGLAVTCHDALDDVHLGLAVVQAFGRRTTLFLTVAFPGALATFLAERRTLTACVVRRGGLA